MRFSATGLTIFLELTGEVTYTMNYQQKIFLKCYYVHSGAREQINKIFSSTPCVCCIQIIMMQKKSPNEYASLHQKSSRWESHRGTTKTPYSRICRGILEVFLILVILPTNFIKLSTYVPRMANSL